MGYIPLVICYIAIENDHRNSGFSQLDSMVDLSIVMGQFTRGYLQWLTRRWWRFQKHSTGILWKFQPFGTMSLDIHSSSHKNPQQKYFNIFTWNISPPSLFPPHSTTPKWLFPNLPAAPAHQPQQPQPPLRLVDWAGRRDRGQRTLAGPDPPRSHFRHQPLGGGKGRWVGGVGVEFFGWDDYPKNWPGDIWWLHSENPHFKMRSEKR